MRNHKAVLIYLFGEHLKASGVIESESICSLSISDLLKLAFPFVANIFLNNY